MGLLRRDLPPLLLAALSTACGTGGEAPPWRSLADGFRPRALAEPPATIGTGETTAEVRLEDGALRVRAELPRAAWRRSGPDLWVAPRPFAALGDDRPTSLFADGDMALPALTVPDRPGVRLAELPDGVPPPALAKALRDAADPSGYHAAGRWLHLCWPGERPLPATLRFEETVPLGEAADGAWRVILPGLAADGLPLLPGVPERLALDVPPGSVLRCAATAVAAAADEPATLRVALDGEELLSITLPVGPDVELTELTVVLPAAGRRGARLELSLEGPPCLGALLDPLLAPAAPAARGARAHPDVVLLLADTYRADNLSAWGGDPALAPHLNALAERSRRFVATQTPGTWTLPAHAAMFSALYPPQLGVLEGTDRLEGGVHTLAEHFAAAGYRTAAITEGLYVSRTFGLDQGFAWFEEHAGNVAHTVERAEALLARDDGRPLLLFVHSYRAHDPYKVSAATRARLGDRYDFDADLNAILKTIVAAVRGGTRGTPSSGEGAAAFRQLEHLYRGGSSDLDAAFGRFLTTLEAQGVFEHGVVAFTSDHGEAFGEHGIGGHGTGVWQEESLVPLTIAAPGLAPGEDATAASLVDLARTFAGLAGIAPHPGWLGRDLAGEPSTAPVFAFQTRAVEGACDLAAVLGHRKLILDALQEAPERPAFAYDLAQDPGELSNLSSVEASLALLERLAPALSVVRERLHEAGTAVLGAGQRVRLEDMGYAGGD